MGREQKGTQKARRAPWIFICNFLLFIKGSKNVKNRQKRAEK